MQIAFHIGANCTDEDRILKSLLKDVSVFADRGIMVPGPGKYRRLIRETIQGLNGALPAPDTRAIMLDAIIDDQTASRLVMSNANFICIANRIFDDGAFYQQAEAKIRGLQDLFAEDDIEIFLALRNPATFLPEVFADSKQALPDVYLKGMHPTQIRWSDLVRRIQHVFPTIKLTVWCNEDTPLIWAELLRAIGGIDADLALIGEYDLLAAIMSAEGMARFHDYLKSHPPKNDAQKQRVIAAFLDKFAVAEKIEETVDWPGMTEEMVDELTRIYDNDVDVIAQMQGVTFIAP